MVNLLLIVLAVATMGMAFSGQHLTASMLEIDLSPSPLYPKARRGGGAYASTELLLRWIWSFRRSLALLLPSPSRLGINTGGNTEGGQQGEITFLHSSSHAGPLLARFAGGLRILGWAHFAVAVVVLVIDALHGDWLTIMIILALRVSNFRCSCATCGWSRSARGRRMICRHVSPRAWVSCVPCTYWWVNFINQVLSSSDVDFQNIHSWLWAALLCDKLGSHHR